MRTHDEQKCAPSNIWEYRQNKPSRIIRALGSLGVSETAAAQILMAHGVYKWLAARRDLIRAKNSWRAELTALYRSIEDGTIKRGTKEHHVAVGRIAALEQCRGEVRAICHSQRWRAPDHDPRAMDYFAEGETT